VGGDAVIMAAAIADFRPLAAADKLKRTEIGLAPTSRSTPPDLLRASAEPRNAAVALSLPPETTTSSTTRRPNSRPKGTTW
jgi:hypothetical protein